MLFASARKLCNNWSINSRSLLAAASLDVPGKNRCHQSKCSKCSARLMIRFAWCSRWLLWLPSSCRRLCGSRISPAFCHFLSKPFFTHSFYISDCYRSRVALYPTDKRSKREGEKVKNEPKGRNTNGPSWDRGVGTFPLNRMERLNSRDASTQAASIRKRRQKKNRQGIRTLRLAQKTRSCAPILKSTFLRNSFLSSLSLLLSSLSSFSYQKLPNFPTGEFALI